MTADTQDAERLDNLRKRDAAATGSGYTTIGEEDRRFLLRMLDARDARIAADAADMAEQATSHQALIVRCVAAEAALADQQALAAEAQQGNAETIGRLRDALAQAEAALEKYGKHADTCRNVGPFDLDCDCGYFIALRRAPAAKTECKS